MKDHLIAQAINELRDIARDYHATQQLRARIAEVVLRLVKSDAEPEHRAIPREPTDVMLKAAESLPCVKIINDVLSLHQVRMGYQLTALSERTDVAIWHAMYDAFWRAMWDAAPPASALQEPSSQCEQTATIGEVSFQCQLRKGHDGECITKLDILREVGHLCEPPASAERIARLRESTIADADAAIEAEIDTPPASADAPRDTKGKQL